jgi:N-methylhydantoinase B
VIREYQILVDGCSLQSWCERSVTKPWGLFTDEEAKGPWVVVGLGSENERLLLKASDLPVKAGTIVQISTGGGGGFGNPVKRERERVRYDVENGYISPQRAAAVYKQVFDDYPESR